MCRLLGCSKLGAVDKVGVGQTVTQEYKTSLSVMGSRKVPELWECFWEAKWPLEGHGQHLQGEPDLAESLALEFYIDFIH